MPMITCKISEYSDTEVVAEYNATPYVPAKTDGPPENCHPEEGGEVELLKVYFPGDRNRADILPHMGKEDVRWIVGEIEDELAAVMDEPGEWL